MGTGRTLNKTSATRPVKKAGERRRRERTQRARLVKLGYDEAAVKKLTPPEVRALLRAPKKAPAAAK